VEEFLAIDCKRLTARKFILTIEWKSANNRYEQPFNYITPKSNKQNTMLCVDLSKIRMHKKEISLHQ
jgi:hypothetical protein